MDTPLNTPLTQRRERGDLIQTYTILHGFDEINWCSSTFFPISTSSQTRGHSFKIQEREIDNHCDQIHHFLTNRIIAKWNKLPECAVSAPSTNSFKAQIDPLYKMRYYSVFNTNYLFSLNRKIKKQKTIFVNNLSYYFFYSVFI